VGGNVSLYNEAVVDGEIKRINPTPQIMIAGIFDKGFTPIRRNLVAPWANIFLVGETLTDLNGSEYQRVTTGQVKGVPPKYRPDFEKRSMHIIQEAHQKGLIRSCNNVGRGGVAIALMKMAIRSKYGFKLNMDYIPGTTNSLAQRLYSETAGRYLAEVTESNQEEFLAIVEKHGTSVCELGLTVKEPIADFGVFSLHMDEARKVFANGLKQYME
jgi:phosphoribosylformylglycinamidine synthase